MGNFPSRKTSSAFDPKLLQIDLASEISVIKSDIKKKSSISTLNINQIGSIPKNDPKHFTNFLCIKFEALEELNLDDELEMEIH